MDPAIAPGAQSSATEFRMPSLGADMEFGTVVEWRVKPGDPVKRGDVVAEVETEKGVFEVEIGNGGVVGEILVAKGAKVPVGTILATLRGAALAAAEPAPRAERSSPAARRLAQERGIDLAKVQGTGPEHAITLTDVERAAATIAAPGPVATPAPAPAAPAITPLRAPPAAPAATTMAPRAADETAAAMRRAVAAAVSRSKREIPHYYLSTDIDFSRAAAWLQARNAERPVDQRVLPAVLLLKGVALALGAHPALNGFWIDGAFRPGAGTHIGVAISLRSGGLIAPAIHDVDRKTIDEVMTALRDLVRRTRAGGLRGSEMTDATITVSNLGEEGVQTVFGVIYPPQVAMVGFGRIAERAWAERGMVAVHPVVTATLAADHRATDGHEGGLFLSEIDRLLQAPEAL